MPNYRKGVESDVLSDIASLNFVNAPGKSLAAIYHTSSALTPAAVAANTTAEQIFAVSGLAVGDVVFVNKPSAQAGLGIAGARVSSAGNLAITFVNATAASITPTAGETYQVGGIR
jgi:hypothetical protein